MSLRPGAPFPDVPLASPSGPVSLADRWTSGPLVVAFHRLWCPFCRQSAAQLAARRADLERAGASVVLVYPQALADVTATCAERGVPFDCLSDEGRDLETAAAIARMRATRSLTPATPLRALRAMRETGLPGLPDDLLRGRGPYVVDPAGRVAYAHVSTGAANIPPVDDVLDAVDRAGRGAGAYPA